MLGSLETLYLWKKHVKNSLWALKCIQAAHAYRFICSWTPETLRNLYGAVQHVMTRALFLKYILRTVKACNASRHKRVVEHTETHRLSAERIKRKTCVFAVARSRLPLKLMKWIILIAMHPPTMLTRFCLYDLHAPDCFYFLASG